MRNISNVKKMQWKNIIIIISVTVILWAIIAVSIVFADLQKVFLDGKAGRFEEAKIELQRLSEQLEAQTISADLMIVGRNSAALGFYSMLTQIASDCISGLLTPEIGKQFFTAAQKAASGQLDEAASLAENITAVNPNYPDAHLFFGRILMAKCMNWGKDCDKAITYIGISFLCLRQIFHPFPQFPPTDILE